MSRTRVRVHSNIRGVESAMDRAIKDAIMEAAARVEEAAKNNLQARVYSTPETDYRRTGNLINSVSHRMTGGNAAVVEAKAEYAPYVEYGTEHTPAIAFMADAINSVEPDIANMIDDAMRRHGMR